MRGSTPRRRGPATSAVLAVAALLGAMAGLVQPLAAQGDTPQMAAPRASGDFGEPLTFTTTLTAEVRPVRVELLTRLPEEEGWDISIANLEPVSTDTWRASVVQVGHVVPNTTYHYRFRAVTSDGQVLGPEATHRVADERVEWEVLAGDGVNLWWHAGDRGFAQGALEIAEEALDAAGDLLGVEHVEPVDFFVYSDARAFRQAMGPGTRENVGGQAHPDIGTLFGLIEPSAVGSDWVDELITHELTHLVFDEAVRNPYTYPPRWLNEGLAVYLSTGDTDGDRAQVGAAARAGTIIPLEGLGGQFPTRSGRFSLAYAESVSAVDYFVRTYGEGRLVDLITFFADGVSTDEAFLSATGSSLAAFDDDWLASVGATRPEPAGPRPAPTGPVPEAWLSSPAPLLP